MTHEIIKTENYLLVVDESEIKENDWVINENKNIAKADENFIFNCSHEFDKFWRKIIAHLPLNNAPFLEGVDVLPPLDNIRYDFAEMFYNILKATYPRFDEWVEAIEYNKAREKYKYTEEDIENAFNSGRGYGNPEHTKDLNSFIQSLQQPKIPVAFLEKGSYNGTWIGEYIY